MITLIITIMAFVACIIVAFPAHAWLMDWREPLPGDEGGFGLVLGIATIVITIVALNIGLFVEKAIRRRIENLKIRPPKWSREASDGR